MTDQQVLSNSLVSAALNLTSSFLHLFLLKRRKSAETTSNLALRVLNMKTNNFWSEHMCQCSSQVDYRTTRKQNYISFRLAYC